MISTKSSGRITRRDFARVSALATAGAFLSETACAAGYGWLTGGRSYYDSVTRALVHPLGDNKKNAKVVYQTHPQWLEGTDYLLYMQQSEGAYLPHLRQMRSGIVRPMLKEPTKGMVLSPSENLLYFVNDGRLYSQSPVSAFQRYRNPSRVGLLPKYVEALSGGLSVDANKKLIYVGAKFRQEGEWGIVALDRSIGLWHVVTKTTFQVGHVQAHPTISKTILFCHETGGDAPQRMWRVRDRDEEPQPLYKEYYEPWVTHEVWWGSGRVLFTLWPYDEQRLEALHGIVSVDLTGKDFRLHCQYKAWHCHGSPDGRWIVGDDFDRNLWLIQPGTGERRLLTQGHKSEGFDTHPHASFTPDSKGVVFTSSRHGHEEVMVVEIPEWDSLPEE